MFKNSMQPSYFLQHWRGMFHPKQQPKTQNSFHHTLNAQTQNDTHQRYSVFLNMTRFSSPLLFFWRRSMFDSVSMSTRRVSTIRSQHNRVLHQPNGDKSRISKRLPVRTTRRLTWMRPTQSPSLRKLYTGLIQTMLCLRNDSFLHRTAVKTRLTIHGRSLEHIGRMGTRMESLPQECTDGRSRSTPTVPGQKFLMMDLNSGRGKVFFWSL